MFFKVVLLGSILSASMSLAGCTATVPAGALAMQPVSLERRQLQTRRFDSRDERKMLQACAGLMQDLGFNIDAGESDVGLIVGSKNREAVDGGQVAGAIVVALLFGVSTPTDTHQTIRGSVVTAPNGSSMSVRVTFQRVVWNSAGQVSRMEFIDDAEIYQEFFVKLSKSVFLEAHNI